MQQPLKKNSARQRKSLFRSAKSGKIEIGNPTAQYCAAPIANRLKRGETNIVERFPEVTVIYIDIVNFFHLTELVKPEELIKILNIIFSAIDQLTDKYSLEKIKTIGDAYMAVCGAPPLIRATLKSLPILPRRKRKN